METENEKYHLLRIRALLALNNIRQIDIVKKYNIHPTAISQVLSGKRRTLVVRQCIAKELNVDFTDLWSGRVTP